MAKPKYSNLIDKLNAYILRIKDCGLVWDGDSDEPKQFIDVEVED